MMICTVLFSGAFVEAQLDAEEHHNLLRLAASLEEHTDVLLRRDPLVAEVFAETDFPTVPSYMLPQEKEHEKR